MDIDGVDIVIHGADSASLSLSARPWLEDDRFVGTVVHSHSLAPVAASIRVEVSPDAEQAALAGFDSFYARIDGEEQYGSLDSRARIDIGDGYGVQDIRAVVGDTQYRAIAIEDPFPLLLIPVVVGICAIAATIRHVVTAGQYGDLARDCINKGGTPTIIDGSGASVTFDGKVKVDFRSKYTFSCAMPAVDK